MTIQWSDDTFAEMLRLRVEEHLSYRAIGKRLNLGLNTVYRVLRRLNLSSSESWTWRPRRKRTNEEMLDMLRRWAEQHGRAPARHECSPDNGLPSASALRDAFRLPYAEVVKLAGLTPCKPGRPKLAREVALPPLDPEKVARINAEKLAFWQNGGRDGTWVHPYSRRAQRGQGTLPSRLTGAA